MEKTNCKEIEDCKSKGRYWTFVAYPESMVSDWEEKISELLEYPYAYCIHDKDVLENTGEVTEHRKKHVHVIIAFNNTTTYNHALKIARRLGEINTIKQCINIQNTYNYLIHDTDDSRKKGKYQYDSSERILGNNFDIGCYSQISTVEKLSITKELMGIACSGKFYNFLDFTQYIIENYDEKYLNEFISHQSLLNNIVKGNYHKFEMQNNYPNMFNKNKDKEN